MTLSDRMIALARLTLNDPRAATRALLAEGVPMPARTGGLLLVAVLSALLASLQVRLNPQPMDPVSAALLASPLRAAIVQWVFLALTVGLIGWVGRAFGGKGSFADALLAVVWLQCLALVLQAVQVVATALAPPLAGLIGLGGFVLFLWLLTQFIAELHGFGRAAPVFVGMVLTALAAGVVLGLALLLMVGPEAFQNV